MRPSIGLLQSFENGNELAEAACESFMDLANANIQSSGVFRVALAGGSTPKRLYEMLSKVELAWDKIELYWGDERNVAHEDDDSNYKMVKHTLLDPGHVPPSSVFPVPTSRDAPSAAALGYEQTLRAQFSDSEDWPEFDLVLLGMGDDAHTASLFPGTDALSEPKRWFTENWVPKFNAHRLTLTAPAINAAANVWFMITGANKREALASVWGQVKDSSQFPSQMIDPVDGVLWWMVSAEALG